jgi:fatty acid desaturase
VGKRLTDLRARDGIEWPTLALLVATYLVWLWATDGLYAWSPLFGILMTGLAVAQFSSLQHEALHGHPFRSATVNEMLVSPGITLTVPYRRFRDLHLAHHNDPILTDPYDDPESNYLDPKVWAGLPAPVQALLRANNTILGRVTLGPLIGNWLFLREEWRAMRAGDGAVLRAWGLHAIGLVPVLAWLWVAAMPWWACLIAVWIGHGLLKIRTFLEHRAHEQCRARTVIIEDRGPLSVLFLNNNLHVVHHMHPQVAWYRLPALYLSNRAHYVARNEGYVYRSYAQILTSFFLRAKDPVPHPLMPRD